MVDQSSHPFSVRMDDDDDPGERGHRREAAVEEKDIDWLTAKHIPKRV